MLRIFAVLFVLCGAAHSEENSQRGSEHKAEGAQPDHHGSQQITVPANSSAPTIINISTGKHAVEESQCTKPKGWKEWGSFAWCRSWEWLDAEKTIAGFTVALAFATFYLWLATRALVRDAKEASQRQLRAYLSANPTQISSAEREERFVQITFTLKNHGQTPAREIHHLFGFDVFPNPLPEEFSYPAPPIPVHMNATLFPEGEMDVWFNFNRLITTEEFNLLEQDRLRLHIWGVTFYRTAFESTHHTHFRASVGGAAFIANLRAMRRNTKGPSFKWTWESGHGEGD